MNSVKVHYTKLIHSNLLHFCRLSMKDQKEKLKNPSNLPSLKKGIKYLWISLTIEANELYSKNGKMLMKVSLVVTQTDGKIYRAPGLEESISSK